MKGRSKNYPFRPSWRSKNYPWIDLMDAFLWPSNYIFYRSISQPRNTISSKIVVRWRFDKVPLLYDHLPCLIGCTSFGDIKELMFEGVLKRCGYGSVITTHHVTSWMFTPELWPRVAGVISLMQAFGIRVNSFESVMSGSLWHWIRTGACRLVEISETLAFAAHFLSAC